VAAARRRQVVGVPRRLPDHARIRRGAVVLLQAQALDL